MFGRPALGQQNNALNGWSIGELFVVDPYLIPNTRRDSFEKNSSYFVLHEQLTTIADSIAKDIRNASLKRNTDLASAVKHSESLIRDADLALENGIFSTKKGTLTQKLSGAQMQLLTSSTKNESDEYFQEVAFEELDMLICFW